MERQMAFGFRCFLVLIFLKFYSGFFNGEDRMLPKYDTIDSPKSVLSLMKANIIAEWILNKFSNHDADFF